MSISSILKNWYLQNKRILPWRSSLNPYHIWVSEVILQQTKIVQGLPYYERFIIAFPSIRALALAPEEKLLKLWQGLGYYSRARNLQKGANFVLEQYNGELPANFDALLRINGIGEYTASAIASIIFKLPYAVVDGNVNRVLSRVYGVFEPIHQAEGKKKIKQLAMEILDIDDPGTHNQALMEFGALLCVPANPDCGHCPLSHICFAYSHHKILELPTKVKNAVVQSRYFFYLVILFKDHIFIRKRTDKDIWHGLFEFPLVETAHKTEVDKMFLGDDYNKLLDHTSYKLIGPPEYFTHKLTHRIIETCFILMQITDIPSPIDTSYSKILLKDLHKYPVSRLIHKYLSKMNFLTDIDKH